MSSNHLGTTGRPVQTPVESERLSLPCVQFVHRSVIPVNLSRGGGPVGRPRKHMGVLAVFCSPGKHWKSTRQTAKCWIMSRAHSTHSFPCLVTTTLHPDLFWGDCFPHFHWLPCLNPGLGRVSSSQKGHAWVCWRTRPLTHFWLLVLGGPLTMLVLMWTVFL